MVGPLKIKTQNFSSRKLPNVHLILENHQVKKVPIKNLKQKKKRGKTINPINNNVRVQNKNRETTTTNKQKIHHQLNLLPVCGVSKKIK